MKQRNILFFVITGLALSACIITSQTAQPTQTPQETFEVPAQTPTAQIPQTELTICVGQEPNSLYPFGELNPSAQNILSAIYDGPIDYIGYEKQPVLISQIPSYENGDVTIVKISVQTGDTVQNAEGKVVSLQAGTRIRPAGCISDDCTTLYNGNTPTEMDQMIVTFRLRPGITWADGTPLTAEDSIYSFELQRETAQNMARISRTQIYEAADSQTLQWFSIPGYIDPNYTNNLWHPAPKHIWSTFPAAQLASIDVASRTPLTWGPYQITEWIPTDRITLQKNPYYYRSESGYPKIDKIHFRFISDPNLALSELMAGRCNLIDPTINIENQTSLLRQMQTSEQIHFHTTTGLHMEWLGLGITPASYDDGFQIRSDRPNYFADTYTRQAIAYCIDRKTITEQVLFGLTEVPASYLPSNHPAFDTNLTAIPFDPQIGNSLLEQAGWLDTDNDPSTPRIAAKVKEALTNTPLVLNYITTSTEQRRQVAVILESSLAQCGVGLNVNFVSPNDLFAPGPSGILFGRQFDLAQYALSSTSTEPPCSWFLSANTPVEANGWGGANITGFSNAEYDAACLTAMTALPEDSAYLTSYRQTQIIAADLLPAIPLYSRVQIAVSQPEVCNFELDPTAALYWNIEAIGMGDTCQN